jgi:hypothetical protein
MYSYRQLRGCQLVIFALACIVSLAPGNASGMSPPPSTLVLVGRTVTQDQGAWIIDYRLQHTGKSGIVISPEEFNLKIEGWVSNSRVASHAVPRWSSLVLSRLPELSVTSDIVTGADESQRCRERLAVSIWAEEKGQFLFGLGRQARAGLQPRPLGVSPVAEPGSMLPLSLGPDANLWVRLRLEHQHILYGDYDPLLAVRTAELTIGSSTIQDILPLDREQYLAQPKFSWPEPPEDRRDTRHAVSGPDSLHLEADIPGHQYYRYPERPVRYNTKMRLRFSYLIAAGTEGNCHVRLTQFKETPTSWRPLHAGDMEQCLRTIGRWTKVECIFQTEPEATTLALEFKIVGETEVGEMWIDDVSLEPVDSTLVCGP